MAHSIDDLRGKLTTLFQDSVFDVEQAIQIVKDQIAAQHGPDSHEQWDAINTRMVEIYRAIPESKADQKDQAFGILEALAAKSPQGANVARSSILEMSSEGDARSQEKIGAVTQGGGRTPSMEREVVISRVLGLA